MGFHTFDAARADRLERPSRYRYLSREELVAALDPRDDDVVADVGSGTGFYTDDVAPHVGEVVALDVQRAMHERYREKGLPENVAPVTAAAGAPPLRPGSLDAAFSTMTFHEFADREALGALTDALGAGGRLVVADWAGEGEGEAGPPLAERFDLSTATAMLDDAGFEIRDAVARPETFLLVATTRDR
jgi:ubiquinone/menaquinone biosynthesis C-methylase UbiE